MREGVVRNSGDEEGAGVMRNGAGEDKAALTETGRESVRDEKLQSTFEKRLSMFRWHLPELGHVGGCL
jgi:hypothetical protein